MNGDDGVPTPEVHVPRPTPPIWDAVLHTSSVQSTQLLKTPHFLVCAKLILTIKKNTPAEFFATWHHTVSGRHVLAFPAQQPNVLTVL